jgi:hypothetical protein
MPRSVRRPARIKASGVIKTGENWGMETGEN